MELIARFLGDLARVLPEGAALGRPLALAVSGGPDSMAMLWLASRALPGQAVAATVDHGLRPESAGEAAMVADWCAATGVPHATLTVAGPPAATGSLQAWARRERYLSLKRWAIGHGAAALATAHHADDQAETFLMRAARGSGLAGLAAIRGRLQEDVAIVRPLLGWRRAELRALCEWQGLPFVDDPTNIAARFDRTRFRDWLAGAPWLDPAALGRSAAYLAEVDRDLLAASRWLYAQRRIDGSPHAEAVDVTDLPRGVRRLIARIAIDAVRTGSGIVAPAWSWATSIEPLLDTLDAGRAATHAGVLATPRHCVWRFAPAPPRRAG